MKHRVMRKQQNSKMCLVCGLKNPFGLKGSFYELANDELVCIFKPGEVHQSYPGRLHGGIVTAILDETIGRAIMMKHEEMVWGVTMEFFTRFKKPIPLDQELRVVGRITGQAGRIFEGTGEVILPGGEIAATGNGKYMRLAIEKIADFDQAVQEWRVVASESDPETIDI